MYMDTIPSLFLPFPQTFIRGCWCSRTSWLVHPLMLAKISRTITSRSTFHVCGITANSPSGTYGSLDITSFSLLRGLNNSLVPFQERVMNGSNFTKIDAATCLKHTIEKFGNRSNTLLVSKSDDLARMPTNNSLLAAGVSRRFYSDIKPWQCGNSSNFDCRTVPLHDDSLSAKAAQTWKLISYKIDHGLENQMDLSLKMQRQISCDHCNWYFSGSGLLSSFCSWNEQLFA